MPNIDEYKLVLNSLANKASEEFINNSSVDHAAAMIEVLFTHAKEKVRILTDSLCPDVYDRTEIKDAVQKFMSKEDNNTIDIVMQFNRHDDDDIEKNTFITFLKEYNKSDERVKFYEAKGKLKNLKWHFMVCPTDRGNYALRFETDVNKHDATGTFNNKDFGQFLCILFDQEIDKESLRAIDTTEVISIKKSMAIEQEKSATH